ncbi:6-hydroxymethylpterin diphosphokinase MptE-like protein [Arcobacter sp. FWKO B]|uniref:motility associated factor glycosyltransferase family protein n=1 Tax=Arcobacter sp. FWKO B TaxID=2593672 RepID=UPI0018A63A1D|nr:6-hydroxymethylpterin diphosphokinase MptE-like protein [Arcobacter sp. FWKO B]QOG12180.1 motility associated factor glycosyltransferase family protein [Arcobacter sp. FWKO B]
MNEELDNLSDIIVEIYLKNMKFLEENYLDTYNSVDELSKKIQTGEYEIKYSLEYIDGCFDILSLENNGLFYHTNSYEDADYRKEHANFTKDGSLDLLRKDQTGIKLVVSQEYKDVMPIIEYMNKTVDFENIEFQKIYKYIFIGTGLGLHIHEINKKLNPLVTMIIEPNLEIFRLSLFMIDYSEFDKGNKKLFLSVGDSQLKRMSILGAFYQYHNYMNYNIKHHLLLEGYNYIYNEVVDFFGNNSAMFFPYKKVIDNLHRTIEFIKDKSRFVNVDLIHEKKILKGKKVLLISAGPSLDNYIDWIEEHQDKFVIICVDVILRKLEKHRIRPDIVVSIDPSELCAKYLTTDDPKYLDNSSIIFLSQQHPDVLKVVKGKHYVFSQSMPLVSRIGWLGSVTNVGAFSFKVAVHLGADELYTIGTDAAFNQDTGSRYAADSSYTQVEDIDVKKAGNELVSIYDILEVKGNLRENVKTNRSLLPFKESFETTKYDLESFYKFKVFNLSDGVYIEGFNPLKYEQMHEKIEYFPQKEFNVQKEIDGISEILEVPDYSNDIKIINRIINKVNKYKDLKIDSRDDLLQKKLDIMLWILEQSKGMTSAMFGNIFLQYIELSDTYINFLLNLKQKDLYTKESLVKINLMWSLGVVEVFKEIKKIID